VTRHNVSARHTTLRRPDGRKPFQVPTVAGGLLSRLQRGSLRARGHAFRAIGTTFDAGSRPSKISPSLRSHAVSIASFCGVYSLLL
jgi:hypothetical protein